MGNLLDQMFSLFLSMKNEIEEMKSESINRTEWAKLQNELEMLSIEIAKNKNM